MEADRTYYTENANSITFLLHISHIYSKLEQKCKQLAAQVLSSNPCGNGNEKF